ncbi:MAG: magnesium transporter CorA family protein [Desulfobacterales bacterium]|jgi:magnesium transporter|nr:magnesium transporter CorA family protein [Desulfobacterales bacterium]
MVNVLVRRNSGWQPAEWEAFADRAAPFWVDLFFPQPEEIKQVGAALAIEIPSRAEMEEIEASSRLYQEGGAYFMTADLVASPDTRSVESSAITFILTETALVTVRYSQPRSFETFSARIQKPGSNYGSSLELLIGLLEAVIDRMADILEVHSFEIERTSQLIFAESRKGAKPVDLNATIKEIGIEGNHISIIRESLITFSRMATFLNQAVTASPKAVEIRDLLRVIGRDIASLADHASFMTSKISFMLDATLGMISIQQNNIIKIFSVAAVVFLPPTLIASIYGMNFQFMPELSHELGYPFAIGLMILSAILPYLYFKRKGWL